MSVVVPLEFKACPVPEKRFFHQHELTLFSDVEGIPNGSLVRRVNVVKVEMIPWVDREIENPLMAVTFQSKMKKRFVLCIARSSGLGENENGKSDQ